MLVAALITERAFSLGCSMGSDPQRCAIRASAVSVGHCLEDGQAALGTRSDGGRRNGELAALGALSRHSLVQGQQGIQVLRGIGAKLERQHVLVKAGEEGPDAAPCFKSLSLMQCR